MTQDPSPLRLVLTGGGTGGHIYPALALAEALQADPEVGALTYVGNARSLEATLVPQAGLPLETIHFRGMPRRDPLAVAPWVHELVTAIRDARRILHRVRPHAVLGTGGYVSAPVLMAARSMGIPYLVHEPDAHPGLVNRLMSRWAWAATVAFEARARRLPARRVVVTGNPLRGQLGRLDRGEARRRLGLDWPEGRPVLMVLGGSQGARSLNQAVCAAMDTLLDTLGLCVIHQTGAKLFDETQALLSDAQRADPRLCQRPYFHDMPAVLAMADLALCRAGSLSLSELLLTGTPMVLVPYPHAAANHQHHNAEAMVAAGAALLIPDSQCTAETLSQTLRHLLAKPDTLAEMRVAARAMAKPDATADILRLLKAAARGESAPSLNAEPLKPAAV